MKIRRKPNILIGLESLMARLPSEHHQYKRIVEECRKRNAGYHGEMNFDKYINEFRPSYPISLLHDVCLVHNGIYFQMDSVLIMPDKIIVFEVKNLAGTLVVKANPTQFIQEINGERKVIKCPITEVERKKIYLDRWLQDKGVSMPIECVIGLAFTNELRVEGQVDATLAFTQEIPNILYKQILGPELLNRNQITNIANEIMSAHQEYNPFPLTNMMGISKEDIVPGVLCDKCNTSIMLWRLKKWICNECSHSKVDSHLKLVDDWFYLMDTKITNRQFRSFAFIEDRSVAKRLLQKSGLSMNGKRGTSYYTK